MTCRTGGTSRSLKTDKMLGFSTQTKYEQEVNSFLRSRKRAESFVPSDIDSVFHEGKMSNSFSQFESALKLWIDGVGCWLVCWEDKISIGNQIPLDLRFKIGITADLRTEHVLIKRRENSYEIQTNQALAVDGVPVDSMHHLCHGEIIELGEDVRIRFRVPSPLSSSAVISMESAHRIVGGVDGVVLMDQTCLMGSGRQCHISCPMWSDDVVLFRRGEQFSCKSVAGNIEKNGVAAGSVTEFVPGDHLTGNDWSFRAEEVKQIA